MQEPDHSAGIRSKEAIDSHLAAHLGTNFHGKNAKSESFRDANLAKRKDNFNGDGAQINGTNGLLKKREDMNRNNGFGGPGDPEFELTSMRALIERKLFFEKLRRQKFGSLTNIPRFTLSGNDLKLLFDSFDTGNAHCDLRKEFCESLRHSLVTEGNFQVSNSTFQRSNNQVPITWIGFNERSISADPRYAPDINGLPLGGFSFGPVDFEKIIREGERQQKASKSLNKKQTELKQSAKEPLFAPPKSRKNEYQLVVTPRMATHEKKRIKVSSNDAFKTFSEITRIYPPKKQAAIVNASSMEPGKLEVHKGELIDQKMREMASNIVKIQKFFQRNDVEQNMKKLAILSAKVVRKNAAKTKKSNKEYILQAKKVYKEVVVFWKRKNKEMIELKKKKEKIELELKKREEEKKEQERQLKKIEYLITQSAFYANIMADKLGMKTDSKVINNQLIGLSEEEKRQAHENVHNMIHQNEQKAREISELLNPNIIAHTSSPTKGRHTSHGHTKHHSHHNGSHSGHHRPHFAEKEVDETPGENQNLMDKAGYDFANVEIAPESRLVEVPQSFHGSLKEYQVKGLRWLDNLYEQGINGILADEMGLGKTIQALALLAHLSEHKNNWGPFLIIAPATTLFNWHSEVMRFIPGLKVLPYWGSLKQRKDLRRYMQQKYLGQKESNFHVVITSYQIAVLDEKILQRITWAYIVLDEAQAIKNINSQRWQILLSFKSRNKLLLTGTPIQNTMAELWALLHFIMPKLFDSHEQFQEWFSKDIEAHSQDKTKLNQTQLDRLHAILKPFMLRRVKKDVEKEIGQKFEHEVFCELSKRQRVLYDRIKSKISISDFFFVKENEERSKNLMNLVMQLRKVCNHPDLFERKIVRSSVFFSENSNFSYLYQSHAGQKLPLLDVNENCNPFSVLLPLTLQRFTKDMLAPSSTSNLLYSHYTHWAQISGLSNLQFEFLYYANQQTLLQLIVGLHYVLNREKIMRLENRRSPKIHLGLSNPKLIDFSRHLEQSHGILLTLNQIYIPRVICYAPTAISSFKLANYGHKIWKMSEAQLPNMEFPQFTALIAESSKLHYLDQLLYKLKCENKRVLIFCQMTKMMDILEEYLQYRQYHYFRLDGSCNINDRRDMVREYQHNDEIFVFLLSTRAGGLGVTLTAADVVIFFDNDWNPTMDAQAADRAHRIGRTRDVDVYILISKHTIEERIVKRAKQKKSVQQTVYSGEAFKGSVFKPQDVMSLLFEESEMVDANKYLKQKAVSHPHPKRTGKEGHGLHPRKNSKDEDHLLATDSLEQTGMQLEQDAPVQSSGLMEEF